jgi:hypothetical protein
MTKIDRLLETAQKAYPQSLILKSDGECISVDEYVSQPPVDFELVDGSSYVNAGALVSHIFQAHLNGVPPPAIKCGDSAVGKYIREFTDLLTRPVPNRELPE